VTGAVSAASVYHQAISTAPGCARCGTGGSILVVRSTSRSKAGRRDGSGHAERGDAAGAQPDRRTRTHLQANRRRAAMGHRLPHRESHRPPRPMGPAPRRQGVRPRLRAWLHTPRGAGRAYDRRPPDPGMDTQRAATVRRGPAGASWTEWPTRRRARHLRETQGRPRGRRIHRPALPFRPLPVPRLRVAR
jgi:hypothetical protein